LSKLGSASTHHTTSQTSATIRAHTGHQTFGQTASSQTCDTAHANSRTCRATQTTQSGTNSRAKAGSKRIKRKTRNCRQ